MRNALAELPDHAARELTTADFAEHEVIKVADAVEVDINRRAWKVDYASAIQAACRRTIDGIVVPLHTA